MNRVFGKVAIVTGGGCGIGAATCRLLAAEGAKVAVTDVNEQAASDVAAEIRHANGVASSWHVDVTDDEQVQQTFGYIEKRFGAIDVLVNNAGVAGVNKPTDRISVLEWDAVMNVNVKGVFLCTKHAIPALKRAGGGSIINLSSIYGLVGGADLPPYHASKGAVRLMTKNDALLYAKDGIRVNSVHPGCIWTPMVEELAAESGGSLEEFRQAMIALHPLGRIGEPDDVAFCILYLASDEARFITGSELVIDGGYTAR